MASRGTTQPTSIRLRPNSDTRDRRLCAACRHVDLVSGYQNPRPNMVIRHQIKQTSFVQNDGPFDALPPLRRSSPRRWDRSPTTGRKRFVVNRLGFRHDTGQTTIVQNSPG